jgi:acetylornithine deacetylase/succinyl-diaminopimelate desuccinylase-like protein
MFRFLVVAVVGVLTASVALAQLPPEAAATVQRVMGNPKYKDAIAFISRDQDRVVAETIRLTEIAAPPFKEAQRAKAYAELMRQYGLADVHIDEEGNVLGLRKGAGGPLIGVSAHLDTVFPEGTDVKVKRDGAKLRAPGVSDDTRGLAVMLALIRALDAAKVQTGSDILFVASVGEEGLGDLRGMKHLFLKSAYKDKINSFIDLDGGAANRIVTTSLGSRRYRLTFTGPGGHSYGAFGTVNPMFAMGEFLVEFGKTKVAPQSSYSASVAGGGTSVNAIPAESWMEIDMRSASPAELTRIESRMKAIATAAAANENKARSTTNGSIGVKLDLLGDRPAGSMPLPGEMKPPSAADIPVTVKQGSPLPLFAYEAIKAQGLTPEFTASSTDSNVAMSIGIPAITIAPGVGDRAHALDEWLDADKDVSMRQFAIVLTTVLATTGMREN